MRAATASKATRTPSRTAARICDFCTHQVGIRVRLDALDLERRLSRLGGVCGREIGDKPQQPCADDFVWAGLEDPPGERLQVVEGIAVVDPFALGPLLRSDVELLEVVPLTLRVPRRSLKIGEAGGGSDSNISWKVLGLTPRSLIATARRWRALAEVQMLSTCVRRSQLSNVLDTSFEPYVRPMLEATTRAISIKCPLVSPQGWKRTG